MVLVTFTADCAVYTALVMLAFVVVSKPKLPAMRGTSPAESMSYECQELQNAANDIDLSLEERDKAAEQLEQLAENDDAPAQYIIGTAYPRFDPLPAALLLPAILYLPHSMKQIQQRQKVSRRAQPLR